MSNLWVEIGPDFARQVTTTLGQATIYEMSKSIDGSEVVTVTAPNGLQSVAERDAGGSYTSSLADGTRLTVVREADARWGITTPVTSVMTELPSGLTETVSSIRKSYATDSPLAPAYQDDLTFVNGRLFKSSYDAPNRRYDHMTPENRLVQEFLDEFGRTIATQSSGSPNIRTVYIDDKVTSIVVDPDATPANGNERTTQLTYDSAGHLTAVTDPLTNVMALTDFDTADRPETIVLPDSSEVQMTYDVTGNVTSVTPPGRTAHDMTYGLHGRIESYTPPVGNTVSYEYDLDRHVDLIDFGLDGEGRAAEVDFLWDSLTAELLSVTSPTGTIDVGYTLGKMTSMVAPSLSGPITTNLVYDGPLPTSLGWSGPVSGQVNWTYNDRFLMETETIGALPQTTVIYRYDDDGLTTQAGDLVIERHPASGRVLSKTVGNIRESFEYNELAELSRQTVELMSGTTVVETLYDIIYDDNGVNGDRDALGRITKKTELIVQSYTPGASPRSLASRTYTYGYNQDGRPWLESVAVDGSVVSSYGYDANGNRTSAELSWSQLGYDASFDVSLSEADTEYNDADQLLTYGDTAYEWNNFGQLVSRTRTSTNETTSYEYDLYGNLLSVALPDGRTIEYDVDGAGRRVGRRVQDAQGREVEYRGWIYRDLLRPIAEVDAAGNVVARYVYEDDNGPGQNGVGQIAARLGAIPHNNRVSVGMNAPTLIEELDATGNVVRQIRLLANQVGSIVLAIDSSTGEILERNDYTDSGTRLLSGGLVQPFGFGGGIQDELTGLVRFGARDYSPGIGRWLSRDPIMFWGRQYNLYLFVDNDPINSRDTTGTFGVGGFFLGAGIDLGLQLWKSGGRLECVDWSDVLVSGAMGVVSGGIGNGLKALQATRAAKIGIGAVAGAEVGVTKTIFKGAANQAQSDVGFGESGGALQCGGGDPPCPGGASAGPKDILTGALIGAGTMGFGQR